MSDLSKLLTLVSFLIGFLLYISLCSGCTKGCQKTIRHYKSSTIGLNRNVTLYSYEGRPIKSWQGRLQIETKTSGVLSWIGDDKKEVKIYGGIAIIEEQ